MSFKNKNITERDLRRRRNEYVIWSVVIVLLVVGIFSAVRAYIIKNGVFSSDAYSAIFASAKKDFICNDGSFFSFGLDAKTKGVFSYYPTQADEASLKNQPGSKDPPWQVGIGTGVAGDGLGLQVSTKADYDAAVAQLQTCKNTDGKTALDIYKVGQFSLH